MRKHELYSKNKFGSYLSAKGETAYDFAKYTQISLNTIYKLLRGEPVRRDIAKRVVRATQKFISLVDLGYG